MVGRGIECRRGAWRSSPGTQTDKALYMILAMVCKNDALGVVKSVIRMRGFESWRKLCKEYGSTSLHEYSNLLEYDFRTTDGLKKKLLKWDKSERRFSERDW